MNGTIKSKGEIDSLFHIGSRINEKGFLIIYCESLQRGSEGRVAFIAGKKLGNAPQRSYAKRVLRHISRENGFPLQGLDVVFVAKRRLFDMDHKQLSDDLGRVKSNLLRFSDKEER